MPSKNTAAQKKVRREIFINRIFNVSNISMWTIIPNTYLSSQNEDLKVIPGEPNSPEQAVNSSDHKTSVEIPKQKKATVNRRAYTYAECAEIIEMINAGKTLDEIHQQTKRPDRSLMCKFFNPKLGVKICRDIEELKKFFP